MTPVQRDRCYGRAAEAWSYEDSAAWLRNAARVKRHGVTVPQPLHEETT